MCGIAAISTPRAVSLTAATRMALLALAERGPMAAGYAYADASDSEVYVAKQAGHPRHLQPKIPRSARAVIIHTRWATQGSPSVAANNHPIEWPGCVLVHNGTIANDAEVFRRLRRPGHRVSRHATVDSECIAAAIADGQGTLDERLSLPLGRNACAWLVPGEREIVHAARVDASPLHLAQLKNGVALLASTTRGIDAMAGALHSPITYEESVPEGQYLTLDRGRVTEWRPLALSHRTISLAEARRLRLAKDQASHG